MSFFCAYCGAEIPADVIAKRKYSLATMPKLIFCNKDCRATYDQERGHFKTMSLAGHDGRVAFLRRVRPHRRPSAETNKKISAALKRRYEGDRHT